jgi:hypothetical protein
MATPIYAILMGKLNMPVPRADAIMANIAAFNEVFFTTFYYALSKLSSVLLILS